MEILLIGAFEDQQTGIYIARSMFELEHTVEAIDSRKFFQELGSIESQKAIIAEIDDYATQYYPKMIMILKGLELHPATIQYLKEKFPDAKLVNWFFDVYLGEEPIWKAKEYLSVIKMFDYYICSLKGVADKLREDGFDNVYYVDEACYPQSNGEVHMNWYQTVKYGNDVSFVGALGYLKQHSNRTKILKKVSKECFNLSIWGPIVEDWTKIGVELKPHHRGKSVINETHSMVAQSSLINLGIDQNRDIDMGHSARLYRVMCAGGLYLLNATKGVDKMFKVNKDGAEITGDEELVFYYSEDDLINKIDFLLEHDDIRKKIAKNGQKAVLEKHKFTGRINEIIELIGEK